MERWAKLKDARRAGQVPNPAAVQQRRRGDRNLNAGEIAAGLRGEL